MRKKITTKCDSFVFNFYSTHISTTINTSNVPNILLQDGICMQNLNQVEEDTFSCNSNPKRTFHQMAIFLNAHLLSQT